MILLNGSFRLPANRIDDARPAMARVIAATRAEDGCKSYSYAEAVDDPGLIIVSEAWESRAALDAHFSADHMKQWQQERAEFGLTERQITLYEVSSATPV